MQANELKKEIFNAKIEVIIAQHVLKEKQEDLKQLLLSQSIDDSSPSASISTFPSSSKESLESSTDRSSFLSSTNDTQATNTGFPARIHYPDWDEQDRAENKNPSTTNENGRLEHMPQVTKATSPNLRLFVGHLSKETTEESLAKYFGNFGSISDLYIATNPRQSYAYITFSEFFDESPMSIKPHVIDGKRVILEHAVKNVGRHGSSSALLVSGPQNRISDQALKNHFLKYGHDFRLRRESKQNGRTALVIFNSPDVVDKVIKDYEYNQYIGEVPIDVRRSNLM